MSNATNVTPFPAPVWLTCARCGRDYQFRPMSFGDLERFYGREHLCSVCQRQQSRKAA